MTKKYELGTIFEVPLPNGHKAYARLFKEGALAFYKGYYDNYFEVPKGEDYMFIVSVYSDLLGDGEWQSISFRPFVSDEDAWPPPCFVKDQISGKFSLYYKGEMTPSTERECASLERAAVWDRNHVIDRLMGDDKWNLL